MDDKTIMDGLREVLIEEFGYERAEAEGIAPDDDISGLGLDSFQFVELTYGLENKYDIKVKNEDLSGIGKISDLISLIRIKAGDVNE